MEKAIALRVEADADAAAAGRTAARFVDQGRSCRCHSRHRILDARNDAAAQAIEQLGYPPPNADLWRTLPPVPKIEAAYLAAENAAPNAGREKVLALLSRQLGQQYGDALLPQQRYEATGLRGRQLGWYRKQ